MTLIDKINRVEYLLKHMPGRHDQQRHDPYKSGTGEFISGPDGNPLIVYHGTMSEFRQFERSSPKRGMQLGFGIHFAEQPDFAEVYATDEKGRQGRIIRAKLKANNMLDATQIVKEGSAEFTLAKKLGGRRLYTARDENGVPGAYMQNAIDLTSPARAERLIKEAGYDAVKYEAIYGTNIDPYGYRDVSHTSPSYIVFDPDQIIQLD